MKKSLQTLSLSIFVIGQVNAYPGQQLVDGVWQFLKPYPTLKTVEKYRKGFFKPYEKGDGKPKTDAQSREFATNKEKKGRSSKFVLIPLEEDKGGVRFCDQYSTVDTAMKHVVSDYDQTISALESKPGKVNAAHAWMKQNIGKRKLTFTLNHPIIANVMKYGTLGSAAVGVSFASIKAPKVFAKARNFYNKKRLDFTVSRKISRLNNAGLKTMFAAALRLANSVLFEEIEVKQGGTLLQAQIGTDADISAIFSGKDMTDGHKHSLRQAMKQFDAALAVKEERKTIISASLEELEKHILLADGVLAPKKA